MANNSFLAKLLRRSASGAVTVLISVPMTFQKKTGRYFGSGHPELCENCGVCEAICEQSAVVVQDDTEL